MMLKGMYIVLIYTILFIVSIFTKVSINGLSDGFLLLCGAYTGLGVMASVKQTKIMPKGEIETKNIIKIYIVAVLSIILMCLMYYTNRLDAFDKISLSLAVVLSAAVANKKINIHCKDDCLQDK